MSTEDRPCYDAAAERAVLGGCLVGKLDVVVKVREIFGDGNPFYLPKHAFIWSAICSLVDERVVPDPVTVNKRMPRFQANWDLRAGPIELIELYERAGIAFNPAHARSVVEYAAIRTVREAAIRLNQAASTGDLDRVNSIVEQTVRELTAASKAGSPQAPWHDLLVDGGRFVLDIPEHIPPVWGNGRSGDVLWAQGEALMLCGPPGVGKSTVAGQLVAARLGLLEDVLTLPVNPGAGRLLYIAGDRPAQIARSLRRTLNREDWHEVVRERLIVWRGPPPHMFTSKPETLLRMAQDAGADTVVIDSLKDVTVGLSEDVPAGQYNTARQMLLVAGIELVELHHIRKEQRGPNGGPPTELSDVYGNQQLTGGAGSVVLLWGSAGQSPVTLRHLKQPQNPVGEWQIHHNHTQGMSRVEHRVPIETLIARSVSGMASDDAARAFYQVANPTARQKTDMRSILNRMVDAGKLLKVRSQSDPTLDIYQSASTEEPPDVG